ncbi:hypothetical protein rosmuc_03749 [Roseovarius mucosus DSM 17069]|uniref:DUF2948 family protein n=1 Tax=Roseovarius mucosus DSM 17069 TaxID=1288298 RepID=A0A0A0HJL6_9RHOB|nr:DUF2948 family protein [Roseovarius mucosus]KGM86338.1 hypothetical protein rosmuc_03749 [Roseovarius mucosus DSM 17069]
MTEDAKFEDGREAPLNLGAMEEEDLRVISSLAQDAVFPITEMTWQPAKRRFGLLLNRFRWEDQGRERHGPERVQSLLVVDNVLRVASQGIDRSDKDTILSILAITFEPGTEGAGHVLLTLAGDGALRLEVEALEVTLKDVTRPYRAPSGKVPHHEG